MRSIVRAVVTLAAAAVLYELLARSGYFAPALLPTIPAIVRALIVMLANGTMIEHAAFTMYRVMFGFGLAIAIGIPLGILMARFQRDRKFLPAAGECAHADPFFRVGPAVHAVVRHRQSDDDPDRLLCRHLSDGVQHLVGRPLGQSVVAARGRCHGRGRTEPVLEGDHPWCIALHHHRYAASLSARVDRGRRRRNDRSLRLGTWAGSFSTPRNFSTPTSCWRRCSLSALSAMPSSGLSSARSSAQPCSGGAWCAWPRVRNGKQEWSLLKFAMSALCTTRQAAKCLASRT